MVRKRNSSDIGARSTLQKSTFSRPQVDGLHKKTKNLKPKITIETKKEKIVNKLDLTNIKKVENSGVDDNKRLFLKVAGVAGLGLAASTLLPKSAEAYVTGSTPTSNVVGAKNASNVRINPATEDTLALIKAQSDLLTFDSGTNPANLKVNIAAGDVGVVNVANTPINPATEDTLALIKAQADKLTFDTSNNLSTVSGVKDSLENRINPAQDDSVILLRRIVKLMESQATVDSGNRQRITIDSLGTGTAVTTTIPVSGTVTATVSSAAISTMAGQNQQMFQDVARNTYANGIRNNLIWS